MKCDQCGSEVIVTFRANQKGVKGVWWCEKCMHLLGKEIDPETKEVTDILAEGGRP